MPTFLGQPLYPGGCPLRPDAITIDGKALQEILLKYYEGNAGTKEKEIIKEYVLYYIGAPLFIIEYDNKEQEQKFKSMPLDDLLDVLLDAGIDPL